MQDSNLPEGWVWTTIEEPGIVVSGGTPSTKVKIFWGMKYHGFAPCFTVLLALRFKNFV